jgi:hypothetical protein
MRKDESPDEMSQSEVIEKLQAEGVDPVQKLVDRLLAFRAISPRSTTAPGESLLARREPTPEELKSIHYTPPQVPLYVDGVSIEPAAISRFDGQILNFVIAKPPGGEGKAPLHAFTGNDHVGFLKGAYADAVFSGSGLATGTGSSTTAPADSPLDPLADSPFDVPYSVGQVQVFQDINYGNNWTWFAANSYLLYPDLRWISRGCFLFWCADWNDQISSMGATNTKVIYFADVNFGGPTLTVYPNIAIPDLRIYGWNDVISSVANIP